ncbi:MAG: exodeoxyribonuclease VII large subunit, partial [Clostridia bacterium]|nr:exodeoxyribonuclease VII large subunit [Clostridia bacterium]
MLRPNAMSVTQLNAYAKTLLEAEPAARNLCVRGEITSSSFRRYYHTYLTIKDDTSSLACFLPHNVLASLRFEPDIGMSVVLIGNISVDEKKGALRFNI